jgi:hypothetical protein
MLLMHIMCNHAAGRRVCRLQVVDTQQWLVLAQGAAPVKCFIEVKVSHAFTYAFHSWAGLLAMQSPRGVPP